MEFWQFLLLAGVIGCIAVIVSVRYLSRLIA